MSTASSRASLALLSLTVLALPAFAQDKLPGDRAIGAATIQVPELKTWLYKLASPEFEGRGTGQPGFALAADYVAKHFAKLGLTPMGDDGTFLQNVPWGGVKVDAEASSLSFEKDGKQVLRLPAARLSGSVSDGIEARGAVTLLVVPAMEAATGSRREVPKIAGLDELDLEGRVVVVFIQPQEGNDRGESMARFQVQNQLQGKNVAALLFAAAADVSGGISGRAGASRRTNPAAAAQGRMPASLRFGGADLQALLAAAGTDAAVLQGKQLAHPLSLEAELKVVVATEKLPACNVVAVLPGSDPQLKDEYVVIGSHLDHLGRRGDTYCPGADDDGSGTTGVMAVAQAFVENPVKPRRSILFVCFCGEEAGLVGSKYFVDHPPIPLASIAAELQMDMIGRDEESKRTGEKAADNRNSVHLVGTQRISNDLHNLCLRKNETAGFDLEWDEEGVFSRSDHANFARSGIPIAFFFTGFHNDYHQVTDTPDKIHYEKLGAIATYVYDIGFELATQDQRPLVDRELWEKNRQSVRGVETPVAPMRAGK